MKGAWVTRGVTVYDAALLKSLSAFPYKENITTKQLGCEDNEDKIRSKLREWNILNLILVKLQHYNLDPSDASICNYEIRFKSEEELANFRNHYEGLNHEH